MTKNTGRETARASDNIRNTGFKTTQTPLRSRVRRSRIAYDE